MTIKSIFILFFIVLSLQYSAAGPDVPSPASSPTLRSNSPSNSSIFNYDEPPAYIITTVEFTKEQEKEIEKMNDDIDVATEDLEKTPEYKKVASLYERLYNYMFNSADTKITTRMVDNNGNVVTYSGKAGDGEMKLVDEGKLFDKMQ